jgi:hypothetical protein
VIENHPDKAATKLARKAKEIHAPSWISIAGHVYLESALDLGPLRESVLRFQKNQCAICKKYLLMSDMDLEHIQGGRPLARCACFFRRLADGSVHTNVQAVHGMFSKEPCHRKKHNREVMLKWIPPQK